MPQERREKSRDAGKAACFMRGVVKYLLLTAAILLIAVGIYTGEPAEVLRKAVNICLECIGVG